MTTTQPPRHRTNVKQFLAVLHKRHGLDRNTVAAMVFERSRQHNVPLTQAINDLVAELDQHARGSGEAR